MRNEKIKNFIKKNIKKEIFIFLAIIILFVLGYCKQNSYFCEFVFSRGISRYILSGISTLTSLLSFSITEWFYFFGIIAIIVYFIKIIVLIVKKDWKTVVKLIYNIVSIVLILLILLNILFTCSYNRYPLTKELELEEVSPNIKLSFDTAMYYIESANKLAKKFPRSIEGEVYSPYTFNELSEMILNEYEKMNGDYFSKTLARPKNMVFSNIMSYLGLTGIYFPYFAEVNINTSIPNYQIPITIAHELAHSKGIMRENEANDMAYYILLNSENDYLRYCGLTVAARIMLNECYSNEEMKYYDIASAAIDENLMKEYNAAYYHWKSYDSFVDEIVEEINDRYLKSSGISNGVKSYSQTGEFLMQIYVTKFSKK